MPRREGQFLVEDFFSNQGGLNTADSPFVVGLDQCTGGKNFDYNKRGAVIKRFGHAKLNTSADSQLRTVGLGLFNKPSATRKVIRAAGTKLQDFDVSAYTFTDLSEDTVGAGTDFIDDESTQPYVQTMFNNGTSGLLWGAGAGASSIFGAYSGTKVTQNGVPEITVSSFTATPAGAGSSITLAAGAYRYTLVFHKLSTGAIGNASTSVEASATVLITHNTVDLAWTITNNDTTKYDLIYIYRSSVSGSTGFTAGSLVTTVASSATTYQDTGSSVATSQNVPRANSTILDNSVLPTSTYNCLTLFKRRLVTASGSTIYFSDVNKSESWPTYQYITVPSGGDITALAVISNISDTSSDIDEYLVVFKQTEVWVVTGDGVLDDNSLPDWILKYVDNAGVSNQAIVVPANGYLSWVNYRGVFMWNGSGKPKYVSDDIEDKFQFQGDLDKSKLSYGFGVYMPTKNQIQWTLSSGTIGEQKYVLKLDLRLTLGKTTNELGGGQLKAVFTPDVTGFPSYAGLVFIPSGSATDERLYIGDGSGFIYQGFTATKDGAAFVPFEYLTPHLTLGKPNGSVRVNKVIAWVLDNGAYDLTLDFWSGYRFDDEDASTITLPVSVTQSTDVGIWDESLWDDANWDGTTAKVRPITFNLSSNKNNSEGDAVRLRLKQSDSNVQVILYGFSVYYTDLPLRK